MDTNWFHKGSLMLIGSMDVSFKLIILVRFLMAEGKQNLCSKALIPYAPSIWWVIRIYRSMTFNLSYIEWISRSQNRQYVCISLGMFHTAGLDRVITNTARFLSTQRLSLLLIAMSWFFTLPRQKALLKIGKCVTALCEQVLVISEILLGCIFGQFSHKFSLVSYF